jgi:hypothetical protein
MADERRTSERVEAITLVELDEGVHGVTRNVSGTGLLIATRAKFLAGDRLELTIHAKSGSFKTAGRVIRVDETGPDEPWRYRVAVHLDEPVPENVVEDGIASAARLLGRASSMPPRP